ncbi:hypothetical protein [Streptomyces odonnellii]|uniref:hypothetical protein n=1 Tax=Streptomyces odonnellii TaxID=1417980 RepID=UPI000B2C4CEB|nr:hypothetical protein [Streptomyces odonnellii]
MFPGCATFTTAVVRTLFAVAIAVIGIGATAMSSGDSAERPGSGRSSTVLALDSRWMW